MGFDGSAPASALASALASKSPTSEKTIPASPEDYINQQIQSKIRADYFSDPELWRIQGYLDVQKIYSEHGEDINPEEATRVAENAWLEIQQ